MSSRRVVNSDWKREMEYDEERYIVKSKNEYCNIENLMQIYRGICQY